MGGGITKRPNEAANTMAADKQDGLTRAVNRTRDTILCAKLETAAGFTGRSRGLLGRTGLNPDEGMLFEADGFIPVLWMHMFFMRFAIDIVFLNGEGRVLKINHRLKPWRVSSMVFGARRALEIAAGAASSSRTEVGDRIEFEKI